MTNNSSSSLSRNSWQRATRFREHLSFLSVVPEHDQQLPSNEKSRFSPESTHFIPAPDTMPAGSLQAGSSRGSVTTLDHLEAGSDQAPRTISLKDRIQRFMYDLRTWHAEPTVLPVQEQHLEAWPPLHIEKRLCPCQDPKNFKAKKEKKRRRWILLVLLIIILIYLLGNAIALNIRVFNSSASPTSSTQSLSTGSVDPNQGGTTTTKASSATQSTSTASTFTLSANQQQCLSQFTLNAPASPSSYPCSSCLPILQSIPANFTQSNQQYGQTVTNGIQFCGLSAVFDTANSAGQTVLGNGSWLQDTKFCAWNGVSCDGNGRVSSLSLTFPGVPAAIPSEIGALTGLTSLQVIGNGVIPGGTLPSSFTNLTALTTLHLESSGMSALPDNLFSSLNKMQTLTLVKNSNFGGGLPSTVPGLTSLQSLIINDQALSISLSTLLSNSSLQKSLKLLDLTSTSLSTSISSTISSFTQLTELHLDDNNIQPNPPSSFPPNLQILSLSNNTALSGNLPNELCQSTVLKSCDLQDTQLASGVGGKCGVCTF